MNREIKFRAIVSDNTTIYFTLKELLENKFSNREILWNWIKEGNKPDEYTGIKDKNGKEIYKGDIVKWTNDYNNYNIDKVEKIEHHSFCGFNFGYNPKIVVDDVKDYIPIVPEGIEVIGNIYENPELCEEK